MLRLFREKSSNSIRNDGVAYALSILSSHNTCHYIYIDLPLKKGVDLYFENLNPLHLRLIYAKFVEIDPLVLEKKSKC